MSPPNPGPEWSAPARMLAPSADECRQMVRDLQAALGNVRAVPEVLGIPALTVYNWLDGTAEPSAAAARAIWLTWALILHPEKCQTVFDLVTWGRFRPLVTRRPRRPADSFQAIAVDDWSI